MKRLTRLSVLVLLLIGVLGLGLPSLAAQDPITRIDTFLNQLTDQELFSGAVLVAWDGEILLSEGYGMANHDWDIPNTANTKFRIASVTKQFTGMSILLLQEQGKLTIYDPICTYIEDCPGAWADITIEHLMTHTSGLREGEAHPIQLRAPRKQVADFKNESLLFRPGEGWSYSNEGYIVLGYIVQEVSGQTYQRFLKEHIFDPLGLDDTGYDDQSHVVKQRAVGYQSSSRIADYINMTVPYAAGGLYSTVGDLYTWITALMDGQVVLQETLDAMWAASVVPTPGYGQDMLYAYGLTTRRLNDHKVIGHGGIINGFTSQVNYFPDDDVTVIVLSNLENGPSWEIADSVARMLFGDD